MKLFTFTEATEDLKTAIKLNPSDKKLRQEFENLKQEKKKHASSQKNVMQKFFSEGIYNEKEMKQPVKYDRLPEFNTSNPQTYFDIVIGKDDEPEEAKDRGRVVFELFNKDVPLTVENFRQLCTSEKEGLTYRGNIFHRVIAGFMAQAGDITQQNGRGGMSIYGERFEDENVWYPHTHKGLLSMANAGPNTNGSQFFLTFCPVPHLNDKHTVFGRVISGYELMEVVEDNKTGAQDKPLRPVTIVDCGELKGEEKMTRESAPFISQYDKFPFENDRNSSDEEAEARLAEKDKESKRLEEEKE
mmetsp:Transcript_35620/g.54465  ORF Transcript_35620/g.54465 Transcript_35620/m.54465 type:complete len:301 (-) Transcript_35620:14-916(-)